MILSPIFYLNKVLHRCQLKFVYDIYSDSRISYVCVSQTQCKTSGSAITCSK